MDLKSDIIYIYTDGACSGNPGPGGWGAVLLHQNNLKEISGGEKETTNNRMELTATIEAIASVKRDCPIELYTDSKYVMDGISSWIKNWKKNGWRTANKKPVKNADLWQELDAVQEKHNINWHWVKGHSGHKYNDMADQLAVDAIPR